MKLKTLFLVQEFILFLYAGSVIAQDYAHKFPCARTQTIQTSPEVAGIRLSLKSGFSINKAKETSLFKSAEDSTFNSKTQSASNNIPFHLEITSPFNDKFSGTISAIFMPEHNVKLTAEEFATDHATYYLNTAVSSYGIMGRVNYEFYKYYRLSQYITIGAGAILNTVNNSELLIDHHGDLRRMNRTIVLLNNSKLNLAWQFGTEIKYSVNKNLSLEIGYLYLDIGKAQTKHAIDKTGITKGISEPRLLETGGNREGVSIKLASHQILLGVEFKL